MQVGLIGAGNMARAMARGWNRPVLVCDALPERASALATETGGQALATNAEVAQQSDLVLLCHKPPGLAAVAAEVAPHARAVASVLGGVPLADLKAAYPDRPVYRLLPSTPVEVRQGAVILATDDEQDATLDADLRKLLAEHGTLVELPDALVDVAMGLMSTPPPATRWWPRRRSTPACAAGSRPTRPRAWWCRRWPAPRSCCGRPSSTRWPCAAP